MKRHQNFSFPPDPKRASRSEKPFASGRWAQVARAVGLAAERPVVVALSGGADSVYLLHLVAAARPRPKIVAVHVDHGLRGEEGREDAVFCARLAASLGIPFVRRAIELDGAAASLEAQARTLRYQTLCEEARRAGVATVLTGHHADDALETLLHRWMRGSDLHGLAGPRKKLVLPRSEGRTGARAARPSALNPTEAEIQIVRPLIAMRREEIRRTLADAKIAWREDGSNASARFTRNRIRNELIPAIEATCGKDAVENLHAFGAAVEALEERLAALTAPLAWAPPLFASARRSAAESALGGSLRRAELLAVPAPIRRRALWRLLVEGTGRAPSAQLLVLLLEDLAAGRATRRSLPGGWSLQLRSDLLHLEPPARVPEEPVREPRLSQPVLPFTEADAASVAEPETGRLELPGLVALPDGRQITAEIVYLPRGTDVLRTANEVEIAADEFVQDPPWCRPTLWVRLPRAGDRFRALGAPGTKALSRFLADVGIPREDRGRIPLVFAGDELVWVAGVRPSESVRVGPRTEARLRLTLHARVGDPAPLRG